MRLLTPAFVERWRDRMINVHPSLLPAFPGLDTHARALAAGVRFHGCGRPRHRGGRCGAAGRADQPHANVRQSVARPLPKRRG
jgi:hypothetical protein